jgi:cysteine desulfurase / selenocysteine lyase
VLDAERAFVEQHYSNVHRGVHTLSQEATDAYEAARDTVAAFIGAADPREVVFTKNVTEAVNLVANSLGRSARLPFALGPGDEVCVTEMEHHSNLVPWQMLCERTGATLRWFPLTDDGRLDLSDLDQLVNERTKVLAFVHQSNILGTVNPVDVLVARAREVGALVFLDAAQSVPNMPSTSRGGGADFVGFTGHKMLGSVGRRRAVGPARAARRDAPVHGRRLDDRGGPHERLHLRPGSRSKFEAGTPPISQAVGLAAAVRLPRRRSGWSGSRRTRRR